MRNEARLLLNMFKFIGNDLHMCLAIKWVKELVNVMCLTAVAATASNDLIR